MRRKELIWVDSNFKKKLKIISSMNGKTILDFTKDLAKEDDFETEFKKQKVKRGGFDIGL